MSRGLSEADATAMIVNGFFDFFVKELPMEYAVELNRLDQDGNGRLRRLMRPAPDRVGRGSARRAVRPGAPRRRKLRRTTSRSFNQQSLPVQRADSAPPGQTAAAAQSPCPPASGASSPHPSHRTGRGTACPVSGPHRRQSPRSTAISRDARRRFRHPLRSPRANRRRTARIDGHPTSSKRTPPATRDE